MSNKYLAGISGVVILSLIIGVYGYSEEKAESNLMTDILDKQQGTVMIRNLWMQEYQKNIPVHEIRAKEVLFSEKKQKVDISFITILIRDQNGIQADVSGDTAIFDSSQKIIELRDHVRYRSQKGGELTCNLLKWDTNKEILKVPGDFTVTQGNKILHGAQLVTDKNLQHVEMRNVEAIVQ